MSGGAIFFLAIIVLVISWFIAKEFSKIAVEKGFDGDKYLWISFLLGMIGYMLVIALPDRRQTSAANQANDVSTAPQADETLPEI